MEIRVTVELLGEYLKTPPLQKEELLFDMDMDGEIEAGWEGDVGMVLDGWGVRVRAED
jgi:hypothetical protein